MAKLRPNPLLVAGRTLLSGLPGLAPTFLIVAMLACVLVPLPTPLVDLLLSVSLAGAVLLLVGSLGIRRTTDFLSFPSMLLLATLFRLALNISTTRLILSQADAGRVVEAFSSFVVRDDLIVGAVMFAIITIVQYVVIARGAERVAEVGARFALDGLPGSQAAIDADLRAGVISAHEASLRRARLTERSNFYGAMDGAIRFVKGDAIAGLAITAVNLAGGLLIGMGRDGLAWDASLDTYARLTVGDGLLAQIPALLVSLAAGVLVSRVDRQAPGASKGNLAWLDPAMLVVPAALLLLLAALPSMPSLAFVTIAVALLTVALGLSVSSSARAPGRRVEARERSLTVRIASEEPVTRTDIERSLAEVRAQCGSALGINIPPVELGDRAGAAPGTIEVMLDERRCARVEIDREQPVEDQVVLVAFRAIMDNAADLIDLQELDRVVGEVRASHPVIAARALESVELSDVLSIVRGFLRERVRLPPMRAILGTLAEGRRFRDPLERDNFPELVRTQLVGHWIFLQLDAMRRLGPPRFVQLTPDAEEALSERFAAGSDGDTLILHEDERAEWRDAIRAAAENGTPHGSDGAVTKVGPIALVTTPRARRAAALLVRGVTPQLPVLSTAELGAAAELYEPSWVSAP